jgi:hypothetical protein
VSNEVGPLNAHVFHERAAVRRLLRHASRGIKMGAAGESTPVIQKQLVPFRQRGFCEEWPQAISDDAAVNQHDGLAASSDLILQRDFANLCSVHTRLPCRRVVAEVLG